MAVQVTITYNNTEIANTSESDFPINITYNGNNIASISSNGNKTLNCAGTKAVSNIVVGSKTLNCANKRLVTNILVAAKKEENDEAIVSISSNGHSSYCFVQINGTKYIDTNTLTLPAGTVITCGVKGGSSSYPGTVTVNGTVVYSNTSTNTNTYNYTIPSGVRNIQIAFSNQSSGGKSSVTYYKVAITED